MTPLLELADVGVSYGPVAAVRGLSLTVAEGEVVALLGANGAGKTTTLRAVSGLVRPTRGSIRLAGRRIDGLAPHRVVAAGVGHVPEGRRVFATMTVADNLELGGYAAGRGADRARERRRVLELFPVLGERAEQAAGTLSGGEQQMLAIGRALMARPRLLLLDEPSVGLAPLVVAAIDEVVRELNAGGTTVLLVEQDAARALRLAHRAYVLASGSLAVSGPAAGLLADPRVAAAYLGLDADVPPGTAAG